MWNADIKKYEQFRNSTLSLWIFPADTLTLESEIFLRRQLDIRSRSDLVTWFRGEIANFAINIPL